MSTQLMLEILKIKQSEKVTLLKKKLIFISFISLLIDGCSTNKAVDTVTVPYENISYKIKTNVNSSINYLDKQYSFFQEQIGNIKSNILENKFLSYIVPDNVILENRKSFVTWTKGSGINQQNVAHNILSKKKISLAYNELTLTNKLALLNDYFFEQEKENYMKNFSIKNPIPKYDEFLTDTDNVKVFNNYKLLLEQSKHKWEINLPITQKKVAEKALSTLYGNIAIENIQYDIENENLHMKVISEFNQFTQNISISLEVEKAKLMKKLFSRIKPSIYFSLEKETISLVGISITFEKENYLAKLSEDKFTKENTIVLLTNDTKLNTTQLNIDYQEVHKNIKPPQWFYNLSEKPNTIIGYGNGSNKEDAKTDAYRDINERLEINIKSESSFEKSLQGDLYTSKKHSKVDIQSKENILHGTKTIESETKDGVVYIAILYKTNT